MFEAAFHYGIRKRPRASDQKLAAFLKKMAVFSPAHKGAFPFISLCMPVTDVRTVWLLCDCHHLILIFQKETLSLQIGREQYIQHERNTGYP